LKLNLILKVLAFEEVLYTEPIDKLMHDQLIAGRQKNTTAFIMFSAGLKNNPVSLN